MTDVALLAARAEIRDLLDTYALGIDTRAFDLVASVFTDDAHLDYRSSGGPAGTRDEVVDWLRASLPAVTLTQHLLNNTRIRVSGDTADARTELLNPLLLGTGEQTQLLLLGGVYVDALTRTGAGWRIHHRVHRAAWTAGPIPAHLVGG